MPVVHSVGMPKGKRTEENSRLQVTQLAEAQNGDVGVI